MPDRKYQDQKYIGGQFLIAMPGMPDPRFRKTVILMCTHNEQGAMGLVLNRRFPGLDFSNLLEQLDISHEEDSLEPVPIFAGGPVETGRGFVLHSADFHQATTLPVASDIALTATIDILRAIAEGKGPKQHILFLGYAGWGPGQLESEILHNGWLTMPADEEILFDAPAEEKWPLSLRKMGVDAAMLSAEAGHA